ncbi:MAG: Leucyl aminopeptidase yscIV [Cirrosporium novae-zelandiae]|nr:MAG: Leucyl aminopeptidase yscIV [Cirrosporium novae-zelandiae]
MKTSSCFVAFSLAGTALTYQINTPMKMLSRSASDSLQPRAENSTLVSPDGLMELISIDDLIGSAQKLEDFAYSYSSRNRVFGGQAHNDTINYIYDELVATGYYDVYFQEQVQEYSQSNVSLTANGEDQGAESMTYSPSGNVTAELILVSNLGCDASDFPDEVEGNIALILRGTCTFSDKCALAGVAGALGAVIYNNVEGSFSGTLGGSSSSIGSYVPVVGISQANGTTLVSALPLNATLYVSSLTENRTTYNVIAETKSGNHDMVIMSGGHTDSVEAGPGINDDGSGIIGNLIVAKALTHFSITNAVRFGFWTAEEFGLLGSSYYTENLNATEISRIKGYLNMDMIASPNYVYGIYDGDGDAFNSSGPAGSGDIELKFQEYFNKSGLAYNASAFDGRSDYYGFIEAGIASGGLFTGAEDLKSEEEAALFGGEAGVAYDVNYHAAGDNMTNLAKVAFEVNTKAIAYVIGTYAADMDSLTNSTVSIASRKGRRGISPGQPSYFPRRSAGKTPGKVNGEWIARY